MKIQLTNIPYLTDMICPQCSREGVIVGEHLANSDYITFYCGICEYELFKKRHKPKISLLAKLKRIFKKEGR